MLDSVKYRDRNDIWFHALSMQKQNKSKMPLIHERTSELNKQTNGHGGLV